LETIYEVYCDGSPTRLCVVVNGVLYIQDIFAENEVSIENVDEIEYAALKYALELLPEGASGIIYSDSQTIVSHMNSNYLIDQVKEPDHYLLKEMIKAKRLSLEVKWIPKKQNKAGKILG